MSSSVWRWEQRGRQGELITYGSVTLWGDLDEQEKYASRWAEERLAVLLHRAEPNYEKLTGWSVWVWSEERNLRVASHANDWLEILRSGPRADRVSRERWWVEAASRSRRAPVYARAS